MVTFTRNGSTYDGATDTSTPVVTMITGSAVQVRGNPERYRELSLVESLAPTLLFSPTDYNLRAGSTDFVREGDSVVWAEQTFVVKDVAPIAPDGFVIAARIIVVR